MEEAEASGTNSMTVAEALLVDLSEASSDLLVCEDMSDMLGASKHFTFGVGQADVVRLELRIIAVLDLKGTPLMVHDLRVAIFRKQGVEAVQLLALGTWLALLEILSLPYEPNCGTPVLHLFDQLALQSLCVRRRTGVADVCSNLLQELWLPLLGSGFGCAGAGMLVLEAGKERV